MKLHLNFEFHTIIISRFFSNLSIYAMQDCKGPFNNYVDKIRGGGGQKMSVFVLLVVECPLTVLNYTVIAQN